MKQIVELNGIEFEIQCFPEICYSQCNFLMEIKGHLVCSLFHEKLMIDKRCDACIQNVKNREERKKVKKLQEILK